MSRRTVIASLPAGTLAVWMIATPVIASGDIIAFPELWSSSVRYMTLDRPVNPNQTVVGVDNIPQFREYYVTPSAIEALRRNEPLPSGTVIVNVMYKARLDAQGAPLKDAAGHFIKGDLIGFGVMEKRAGWGAEYAPELRNGEWEYQVFGADQKVNDKVKLATCFQCHKSRASQDFLFTFDRLKAAAGQ